jgi:hypothetical protein
MTRGCATLRADVHNTLVLVAVRGRGYAIPPQHLVLLSTACRIECQKKYHGNQGCDWGSKIARHMAYQAPAHVIGPHLNLLFVNPPNPQAVAQMSDAERRRFSYFDREESSFLSSRPLNRRPGDSPAVI